MTTEEGIPCPFCNHNLSPRDALLAGSIKIFDCQHCHAEVRQPLFRKVEKVKKENQDDQCQGCASSPFTCQNCGDGVCENHIETLEKYQGIFPKGLWNQLDFYADKVYCLMCFRNILERARQSQFIGSKNHQTFIKWPLVILFIILILIIGLSAQTCPGGLS